MSSCSHSENMTAGVTEVEEESQLQEFLRFLREYLQLDEKCTAVQRYAAEHPFLTLFVIVTMTMCSVPFFIFCIFACGSFIITLIGFMFVEGTVLLFGSMVLLGVLAFVAMMAAGVTVFLVGAFYAFKALSEIFRNLRESLPNLLSTEGSPLKEE